MLHLKTLILIQRITACVYIKSHTRLTDSKSEPRAQAEASHGGNSHTEEWCLAGAQPEVINIPLVK